MSTYRITYSEGSRTGLAPLIVPGTSILKQSAPLTAPGRIEIRNAEGDVFRIQKGTEFRVDITDEGVQPIVTGEIFGIITQSWIKNTMSCYTCLLHSSSPLQILVRPSLTTPDADEYYLAMGEITIHDFDENGRHFVICSLAEGDKALVTYDPAIVAGPNRYSASVNPMSDADYDYILTNYLDSRLWR